MVWSLHRVHLHPQKTITVDNKESYIEDSRREGPGMSAFALRDGVVYHTYSTRGRGLDVLWWRRRDEYDSNW